MDITCMHGDRWMVPLILAKLTKFPHISSEVYQDMPENKERGKERERERVGERERESIYRRGREKERVREGEREREIPGG